MDLLQHMSSLMVDGEVVVIPAKAGIQLFCRGVLQYASTGSPIKTFGDDNLAEELNDWNIIQVSALSGSGIEELISTLVGLCKTDIGAEDGVMITNARHKSLIDEAIKFMNDSHNSISNHRPLEFVVSHLQNAQDSLGGITGEVTSDDILNKIFSKFCIGK